jgi:hypothetical protein
MPLARVEETFDPRTTHFQVVIVDAANQCDVLGLLALYLAERAVVVRDHEQVSPLVIGQQISDVEHLITQHLAGIPNNILYDGKMSLYDLAKHSFGGLIRLLEHFRCVPEIISFSNELSYNATTVMIGTIERIDHLASAHVTGEGFGPLTSAWCRLLLSPFIVLPCTRRVLQCDLSDSGG